MTRPHRLNLRPARWAMLARDLSALAEDVGTGRLDVEAASALARMLTAREAAALDDHDTGWSDRPTFELTLRHAPGGAGDDEAIRALRMALKALWRAHGFRCVRVMTCDQHEAQEART